MERPNNHMIVTGVLTFDEPLDRARLERVIEARLLRFPRFRQRIVARAGMHRFEPDLRFSLSRHLGHVTLAGTDRDALRRAIGERLREPLDPDRPLWKIEVLESPDGRSVILFRIHHCIADGFALLYVLLGMTDSAPDGPSTRAPDPTPRAGRARSPWASAIAAARAARALGPRALARQGARVLADATHLLVMPGQPPSRLRSELGPDKRAAWSAPVALDDVKRIGRALGGTVNDVLLSAVSGALRGTLLDAGEEPFDVRVAVPVSLREPSEMEELGNRFGLVFLDLPVTIAGPQGRFRELKRRMDALKGSPEAILLFRLMQIAGGGPRWVEELLVWILGAKTTAVMTNVPGPREPRYLAGGRIRTIMFWVPQAGRVGVGVSIFSYAGEVRLGLNADARALPDPERVLERFALEIEALRVT